MSFAYSKLFGRINEAINCIKSTLDMYKGMKSADPYYSAVISMRIGDLDSELVRMGVK